MGVSSRRLSSTEMASGFTVCKSLELLVLLLAAQTVPGHSQLLRPTVVPAADQNVPNNTRDNVTYSCSVAAGLNLVWQVENLQITPRTLPAFQDRGITTQGQDGSVLVFTEEALREVGQEYEVRCLAFSPTNLSSSLSDTLFLRVFGPPGPVVDLDAVPFSGNQVLVTWGRPPGFLSDISINYTVVVDRFQTGSPVTIVNETSSTSLTVTENAGPDCVRHLFTVTALNEAGASQPSSVNESIPISPDLSATDASLSILYVNVSSSLPEIAVSFQRARSCSDDFSVTSHSVVVRRRGGGGEEGGGEEVARALASSTTDLLRGVVRDLPRDSALLVEVEACNVLLCRTSRVLNFLTTDVQTASIVFFETFVFINCTFASGSVSLGCVVTLELGEVGEEGEGGGVRMERFWLQRESGSSAVSQCNTTANSRVAYQVISAVDWESDGSLGSQTVPVTVDVTNTTDTFPCPVGGQGQTDMGLSSGAVAGIAIAVAVFVVLVMVPVMFFAILLYRRTRDVRRKPDGAISIEERVLIPRAERRNIRGLNTSMSVPATYTADNHPKLETSMSTTAATTSTTHPDTGTMRSTASLPVHSMQASLSCGPVGEINIPKGKKGKIHMHIWSDTLERCKRTGRTNIQLLPLLDEDHETNTEDSHM